MTEDSLANDDLKYHTKKLPNGITEVTAWSLIPIKESKAYTLHKNLGISSIPHNFKMEQKQDGAYVSTWIYYDYERMERDG